MSQRLAAVLLLTCLLLIGATWLAVVNPEAAATLGIAPEAGCIGLCQGCYCDSIINGECYVNGRPSGCIGCVGNCAGDDDCQCRSGQGGCGSEIAWCRNRDCQPREDDDDATPKPKPTATPRPPTCDEGRTYIKIEKPAATWYHDPKYPVAVHQDPTFRGFDLVIDARGGWAEKRRIELEQECANGPGEYPEDCPNDSWEWSCEDKVIERHDDPLVKIDLPMRLEDSSQEWIDGYLSSRYYGATRKEPLPKTFYLWRGAAMAIRTGLFDYKAQDPGVHGGKIILTTKGTPLNQTQVVEIPYSVPVYLMDTTIQK